MRGENRCKIHSCFIGKDGCKICNEIAGLKNKVADLEWALLDQGRELSELTLGIDETDSFKNMNVEEINALRGFAAAATFQHDCLIKWQECNKFKPSKSKEKLIRQLERQRAENLKMLGVLNADFSEKNWERIKREISKIHKIAADFMNNRDLGEWVIKQELKK